MSMIGELSFFLGLQITQSPRGVFISQSKYLKETLKKFGMEDYKPISTPMTTGCKLCKEDATPQVNQTEYKSMIESVLYLTASRSNIMQAVGIVTRFQACPQESHVIIVKRIFKYLQGTTKYGLWYPRSKDFNLKAYTNIDWAGSLDDMKSTSSAAFFIGDYLVSWILWMKQTLKDIQVELPNPIPIMCDNTSAISISKNPVMHSKTKHIPIKYHFLREQVAANTVKLVYVPTKERLADIFTKSLAREPFEYLRQEIGVVTPPSK
eukprot:PITA_25648